ncbi:MAG: ABC transporter permease subunit [Candidatus Jettenia caeni]|nr:ABC transporter permease subunit [Candidatus Jettenia caeni]
MGHLRKRRLTDKAARWVITFGGAATIFAVLALFVFLFVEVYPLLKGAKVLKEKTFPLNGNTVSLGINEHQELAYAVSHDGTIAFISLSDGSILNKYLISGLKDSTITSVDKDDNRLVLGTNDGRILTVSITFSESFDNEKRVIIPEVSEEEPVQIDDQQKTLRNITSSSDDSTTATVVSTEDGRLLLKSIEEVSTLFDTGEKKEIKLDITGLVKQCQPKRIHAAYNNSRLYPPGLENGVDITSLALDHFMENLYIGTSLGELFHINISDKENPSLQQKVKVSDKAITTLGFLFGDISLAVGDYKGGVNIWMQVRDETSPSGWVLKKIHTLKSHDAPVTAFAPSLRDKGFVTSAANGTIYLNHATSEQNVLIFKVPATPTALTFSPKADGILAASSNNNLFQWIISNPHPEITLKTLFGKVWYEGYEKPEFVWQSTGGTDDFEPKLSLVPLIFGTIKGTVYSMIIAVPIGIFAALYTSQFLHKSLKIIKPVIELMAALPSVILGFLAGLWLAPLIERVFPAIVIMPLFIILSIALALYLWRCLPSWIKGKYRYGAEALFLIPFIIGAIYVAIQLNSVSESFLFGGDYRQWLLHILGLNYDQRNALIVGFAMGFAVIPLIFTISEDAMSNVPNNLTSASLALGATTWHTAVRVVLPTASPGIFSAVMIGFGRAVGETMIVLMATGNTPIMGWNLFNGFRALAANIAVEMPEAPVGGTLYRVLFLAALLLFVTTFIVNTFAETVRQKMKRRYSKL